MEERFLNPGGNWMQISPDGCKLELKIFPRNIPKEYIGESAKTREEICYSIAAQTEGLSLKCKDFLLDFLDLGYGERIQNGEPGWLFALDLQDLYEFFSLGDASYQEIMIDDAEKTESLSLFCQKLNLENKKAVLVCLYKSFEEDSLEKNQILFEEFSQRLSQDCLFLMQYIPSITIGNGAKIHVFYI